MKTLLAAALLLIAPIAAHAGCTASNFAIEDFQQTTVGSGAGLHLSLKGKLVNHCAAAAAAQVRVDAKDGSGKVLVSKQGWPAGTTNIAPGQEIDFDLGRLVHYQPEMQTYAVSVGQVSTW